MENRPYPEVIRLTEESLIALLQGKDLHVLTTDNGKEKQFIFKGPWDGIFLTHSQLSELEYAAEMRAVNMIKKIQKIHVQENRPSSSDKNIRDIFEPKTGK